LCGHLGLAIDRAVGVVKPAGGDLDFGLCRLHDGEPGEATSFRHDIVDQRVERGGSKVLQVRMILRLLFLIGTELDLFQHCRCLDC